MRAGRPTVPIVLSAEDRAMLEQMVARPTTPQALALRARVVLAAAAGETNRDIAARLGAHPTTVGKWRDRFVRMGLAGLRDGRSSETPASELVPTGAQQKPRKRRNPPGEARLLLLEAAREMFCSFGYARASTREIAKRAGVSETLVFRHFGSKTGLFEQAILEPFAVMLDSFANKWEAVLEEAAESSLGLTHEYFELLYGWLHDHRALIMALVNAREYEDEFQEIAAGGSALSKIFDRLTALTIRYLEPTGTGGIDVQIAARLPFVSILGWTLFSEWLFSVEQRPRSESVIEELHGLFTSGFAARTPH